MVPEFVISNIISNLTVNVSPALITSRLFTWQVFTPVLGVSGIQVNPNASHEDSSDIVLLTAYASWENENPNNTTLNKIPNSNPFPACIENHKLIPILNRDPLSVINIT